MGKYTNSKDPKKWIDKAREDLRWTESNLRGEIWHGACFTAQQAAEKALKAYILSRGREHKKIHSLVALLEDCKKFDVSFENIREKCATLTVYYAPVRYPDIAEFSDITNEKAQEAYQFAKEVVEFVEKKLQG